jgi:hypothetical protein
MVPLHDGGAARLCSVSCVPAPVRLWARGCFFDPMRLGLLLVCLSGVFSIWYVEWAAACGDSWFGYMVMDGVGRGDDCRSYDLDIWIWCVE